MRIVAFESEILENEILDPLALGVDDQLGQWTRIAAELQPGLFEMIAVEMGIAQRMDEIADLEPGDLRDHMRQQSIGGDVERHAEERVGRALIELAAQFA